MKQPSKLLEYAVEQPARGQFRTSNELRKNGVFISQTESAVFASGMIWLASAVA